MTGTSVAKEAKIFGRIAEILPATITPHTRNGFRTIQCSGNGFIRPDTDSDNNPLSAPLCDLCEAPLLPGEFVVIAK